MAGDLNCALHCEVWSFWLRDGRYEFRVLETVQSTCLCTCIIIYLIETVLGCWGMCEQVGTTQGSHLGAFSVAMSLCVGIQRSYLEGMYVT